MPKVSMGEKNLHPPFLQSGQPDMNLTWLSKWFFLYNLNHSEAGHQECIQEVAQIEHDPKNVESFESHTPATAVYLEIVQLLQSHVKHESLFYIKTSDT